MIMYNCIWLMTMHGFVLIFQTFHDPLLQCVTLCYSVLLWMPLYFTVWLCLTLKDSIGHCMTLHDPVWLCITLYDSESHLLFEILNQFFSSYIPECKNRISRSNNNLEPLYWIRALCVPPPMNLSGSRRLWQIGWRTNVCYYENSGYKISIHFFWM